MAQRNSKTELQAMLDRKNAQEKIRESVRAGKGIPEIQEREEKDEYVTQDGIVIKLHWINPILIQNVMNSIKVPKRPTYETTTRSGRVEIYPMDAESAVQTPGGEVRWLTYLEEKEAAESEQNLRIMKVLFLEGTECDIPENGWDRRDLFYGLDVPTPDMPDERRAYYLMNHISPEDIAGLMTALMRKTGVPEEAVAEAEKSFRDSILDESEGTGNVEGSRSNTNRIEV